MEERQSGGGRGESAEMGEGASENAPLERLLVDGGEG
jgi:hypothetical protein